MAFNNSFTAVVGATYTAAQYNTHVRDNFTALWVYTTAGDIVYATSATALARLGKPSVDSVLKNTSSGVPSWLSMADLADLLPGRLHAIAADTFNASGQSIGSTSYQDITNATLDIVTTVTCTIIMFARGVFAVNVEGNRAFIQAVVDGAATGDGSAPHTSSGVYVPYSIFHHRTGVTAGTITCKLQGRANAGGNAGIFERGRIMIVAFQE